MKLIVLLLAFNLTSFAKGAQHQNAVVELINQSIYQGDISALVDLNFIGINNSGQEVYEMTYSQENLDKIVVANSTCEYITYNAGEDDFSYTGLNCTESSTRALGSWSDSAHSEAEISEVLQTDWAFSFILDYEVPIFVHTIEDEIEGDIEIYKLDYVDIENTSRCEYITFDPEINFLQLTGITCDRSIDEVIEENLREVD